MEAMDEFPLMLRAIHKFDAVIGGESIYLSIDLLYEIGSRNKLFVLQDVQVNHER